MAVIVADELEVKIQDSPAVAGVPQGICTMIYNLLASYYVWDRSYPKQYQILAFFSAVSAERHEGITLQMCFLRKI